MHGLVCVDKKDQVLRPAIIWCDSRAVKIGEQAREALGSSYCLEHLLNSPGNFTASKLRWVQQNEPGIYERIHRILLPGDFIALKMTGEAVTTIPGLSEGIFWNFKKHGVAERLLRHFEISADILPPVVPTCSDQGKLTAQAASEMGLPAGIPLTYRAGDQPNNALALGVLHPGQVAATGGTSGVAYGIAERPVSDPQSRINAFAHVNHQQHRPRIGQLLCINGAGSMYAWMRQHAGPAGQSYEQMEQALAQIDIGADGLMILPFGNGAERMLENKLTGAQFRNLQFNRHTYRHMYRAAIEGIAFSYVYGIDILKNVGIRPKQMRVGNDNLFQSPTFSKTIASLLDCQIDIVDTTGAVGAARAAGIAIGAFANFEEAVADAKIIKSYFPENFTDNYIEAYQRWVIELDKLIKS